MSNKLWFNGATSTNLFPLMETVHGMADGTAFERPTYKASELVLNLIDNMGIQVDGNRSNINISFIQVIKKTGWLISGFSIHERRFLIMARHGKYEEHQKPNTPPPPELLRGKFKYLAFEIIMDVTALGESYDIIPFGSGGKIHDEYPQVPRYYRNDFFPRHNAGNRSHPFRDMPSSALETFFSNPAMVASFFQQDFPPFNENNEAHDQQQQTDVESGQAENNDGSDWGGSSDGDL